MVTLWRDAFDSNLSVSSEGFSAEDIDPSGVSSI